jgi:hypothetical protein
MTKRRRLTPAEKIERTKQQIAQLEERQRTERERWWSNHPIWPHWRNQHLFHRWVDYKNRTLEVPVVVSEEYGKERDLMILVKREESLTLASVATLSPADMKMITEELINRIIADDPESSRDLASYVGVATQRSVMVATILIRREFEKRGVPMPLDGKNTVQ